jgi:hypothetical protein
LQPPIVIALRISALLLVALSATSAKPQEESVVVPVDELVASIAQEEWSRIWWQWAGSFEQQDSPIADQTGELCGSRQSGPVWFLAGTYGTKRIIRACTIPSGKYLFFPLINYVVMPPASRQVSCMAVMSSAAQMTEQVSGLLLEVDGVRALDLVRHRLATHGCFDMGSLAEPKARVFPSAANGYYVMLRPLQAGKHILNFGGALPSMLQGVTYTLTVE